MTQNETIETVKPVEPHDHPDNHAMHWSKSELRWIAARDAKWAAALAQAREDALEEAAQYADKFPSYKAAEHIRALKETKL